MDILHVDMDAFFASVEVKDNPELKGKPVIVGGMSNRGVVAACTYEARSFGVRSGMSSLMAKKLCPQAIFLPGRYSRYSEISRELSEILNSFSPYVEFVSLDEAFIDVTHGHKIFGTNSEIAKALIREVKTRLDLDCCVGIGSSKLVAKIASKKAKPTISSPNTAVGAARRIYEVLPGTEIRFMSDLDLKEIWGIGPKTVAKLKSYGIVKVSDLDKVTPEFLESLMKTAGAQWLENIRNARDDRSVESESSAKSISVETTYEKDITECDAILNEIPKLVDNLMFRLKTNNLSTRTVTVKIKDNNFKIYTRSHTLSYPTDDFFKVLDTAKNIVTDQFREFVTQDGTMKSPVRLLGLGLTGLSESLEYSQQNLFENTEKSPITQLLFNVKSKFGPDSIGSASLIKDGKLVTKKRGDSQWG